MLWLTCFGVSAQEVGLSLTCQLCITGSLMNQPSCTSICLYGMLWASLREYVSCKIIHNTCCICAMKSFQSSRLIWLFKCSVQPFKSPKPVNMENLPVNNGNGQSYGYTLYETTVTSGGLLRSGDNVRDRALVSLHCLRIFYWIISSICCRLNSFWMESLLFWEIFPLAKSYSRCVLVGKLKSTSEIFHSSEGVYKLWTTTQRIL